MASRYVACDCPQALSGQPSPDSNSSLTRFSKSPCLRVVGQIGTNFSRCRSSEVVNPEGKWIIEGLLIALSILGYFSRDEGCLLINFDYLQIEGCLVSGADFTNPGMLAMVSHARYPGETDRKGMRISSKAKKRKSFLVSFGVGIFSRAVQRPLIDGFPCVKFHVQRATNVARLSFRNLARPLFPEASSECARDQLMIGEYPRQPIE